ncbi:hypothetical protein HETIRDRAFT_441297 [Heterobasidion irregulare TC 32-1]|uniref:Uncharacterized protein n=1 Tax=Heterobasidion irregulare (strain TC 32-1) TaxID=747525 RepID=W4K0R9_HETIT|nr:uncharacterized protein HETIRDRAFT_441297 [Heterobasidion irregulare TC 32-1]ETW79294.1 hypothetical protein HETIRDRAFT_441297 [Heterobasidion irregulare TC 32-1]
MIPPATTCYHGSSYSRSPRGSIWLSCNIYTPRVRGRFKLFNPIFSGLPLFYYPFTPQSIHLFHPIHDPPLSLFPSMCSLFYDSDIFGIDTLFCSRVPRGSP